MYCGIDVSKNKSNICILDQEKKVINEFEIEHDKEGFEKLKQCLNKEMKIGLETTSNYCKTLYNFLRDKCDVSYVDNVQMKNFSKLHNLHLKNDKIDAKIIAKYMAFDFKKINPIRMDELKDLARLYYKTQRQLTRYKCMFKDQINMIFPELEKHFYLKRTKAIGHLLLKYPRPKEIRNASYDEVYFALTEKLIRSVPYVDKTVKKIKELAENSVGIEDYPVECFKHTIEIMMFYQDKVDSIKKNMKECLMKTPYHKLLDEWGYKDASLSMIVGEVKDVRRFSNYKKFVKYCGFDISEKQSGSSISKNAFITKRGNSILRGVFYNMVLPHLKSKKEISEFYYRLKEKGKHAKQCQVACARKLAVKCYFDMKECHE